MSYKRFTTKVTDTGIYYYDGDDRIFERDMIDLLNNLNDCYFEEIKKNRTLTESNNRLRKQNEELYSEIFNLEQIVKTGKMSVENKDELILIAEELLYLITHKDHYNLEDTVDFKKRIQKLSK